MRRNLLRWYERHRRRLPWRESRDPYRIWVSEVMLQQTRVQAVIPYYEKFLRLFPDIQALAAAKERSLLACWSGLGYYSRARNLRKAAREITREWDGAFPREYAAARELPGVGDYTARAVLSIAYGIPLAVLDGNVARVLSRLYARKHDIRSPRGKGKLLALAETLLARRRAGDFNQAMMELGATVCVPVQPRCEACPLRRHCLACARDQVEKYPPPRRAMKPTLRRFVAALIRDAAGRCLLIQRPRSAKRMAGFWELPMWEQGAPDHSPLDSHPIPRDGIALEELLGRVRHSITTNQLEINVHSGRLRRTALLPRARWVLPSRMDELPVTTTTRKALLLRSKNC
ncbi:MAG: A/G-specific adenine glycosylase [Terriglobia bacterium]